MLQAVSISAAQKPTVFVSDANAGDVPYFRAQKPFDFVGTLAGSPLGAPFGLAIDNRQNLYVCNWTPGSPNSTILVYPKAGHSPDAVLMDNDAAPYSVAVGNDRTVYVANLFLQTGNSKQYPGNVVVYPPGSTTPSATLTDKSFGYVTGVAVDANANVYVSYDTGLTFAAKRSGGTTTGKVAEFPAGSMTPKELFSTPGPKGNSGVDSIALDAKGNIVVLAYWADDILVYPPGDKRPVRAFGLDKHGIEQQLAFDSTGKMLFVPVLYENEVDVFDYTSGALIAQIADPDAFAGPVGIAVAPRLALPR